MGHVSVPPCLLEQLVRVSRACARLAEIVATAAVFTAGCSFSDGGDRGQVPLDPRPLSAVLVTSVADTARLREQEESAVAHCMARRGFRYVPERTTVSERTVTTNPYGLLREMQAHQDVTAWWARSSAGRATVLRRPFTTPLAGQRRWRSRTWRSSLFRPEWF